MTLDPNVNYNETVSIEWSCPGGGACGPTSVMGGTSTLIISPLSDQDDDGLYTCTGTVTGGTNVSPASKSSSTNITIMGKLQSSIYPAHLCSLSSDLPEHDVIISGNTTGIAGEEITLLCTVTTLANLVASAELTVQWIGGSVNVDGDGVTESAITVNGVTSTRNLTFSPLLTSHGAQYICQATINIPSISVTKTSSNSTDVMVQSK